MEYNILITGGTGFVGFNLLRELAKREEYTIYLLARSLKDLSAQERINNLLHQYCSAEEREKILSRMIILEGEVTQGAFGLRLSEYELLCKKIHIIYHSAASIQFNLTYEKAKSINYEGTKNILNFASDCQKQGQFIKMNHISTAYISGDSNGLFFEHELDKGQKFFNSYEQTKFETEKLIREYEEKGLAITVFRPSIISANYKTGHVFYNNVLFVFALQFANHMYDEFVCDEDSCINIIPIDYFVESVLRISEQASSSGRVYHIINHQNTKAKDVVSFFCDALGVTAPRFIPFKDINETRRRTRRLLEAFINYIRSSHTFDDEHAVKALQGSGISCPKIDKDYFAQIIKYGRENDLFTGMKVENITSTSSQNQMA